MTEMHDTGQDETLRSRQLYDYTITLLKSGEPLDRVRKNLMQFGLDQQQADDLIKEVFNRPPEISAKRKFGDKMQAHEAFQKSARNWILMGVALGSIGFLVNLLGSTLAGNLGLLISVFFGLIGGAMILIGLYRLVNPPSMDGE
jgi:hypothetical protein